MLRRCVPWCPVYSTRCLARGSLQVHSACCWLKRGTRTANCCALRAVWGAYLARGLPSAGPGALGRLLRVRRRAPTFNAAPRATLRFRTLCCAAAHRSTNGRRPSYCATYRALGDASSAGTRAIPGHRILRTVGPPTSRNRHPHRCRPTRTGHRSVPETPHRRTVPAAAAAAAATAAAPPASTPALLARRRPARSAAAVARSAGGNECLE